MLAPAKCSMSSMCDYSPSITMVYHGVHLNCIGELVVS